MAAGPLPAVSLWFLYVLEREITLIGHTASRLLVYLTVRLRSFLPVTVALAAFVLVDGGAMYGEAAKWNWNDPALLAAFCAFTFAVGHWKRARPGQ